MTIEPNHVVPAAGPDYGRRLLLLSYHFPPGQAAGALRWQKMAPFLFRGGWTLDVISRGPFDFGDKARTELDSLPPGTRIFWIPRRSTIAEKVERRLNGIRRGLIRKSGSEGSTGAVSAHSGDQSSTNTRPASIPPEAIRWEWTERGLARAVNSWLEFAKFGAWSRDVARLGTALASRHAYGMVATSGPPHMVHAAGVVIARAAAVPLLVDFRDPWSLKRRLPEAIASPLWFRLARRHERRVVRRASLIVTNTQVVRDEMERVYPGRREAMITVMNGSDDDLIPEARRQHAFVVAYAGGIYLDRDPRTFFRGASRMVRELGLTPDRFRVLFIGNVQRYGALPVSAIAGEEGLAGYVELKPPIPRSELMKELASAAMLLSLPQDSRYAIPSKIFEYMQFDAWVLVLAGSNTPTARALEGTAADVVDPDRPEAIADTLRRRYLQFAAGETPGRPDPHGTLSRERQAMILLDAMQAVLAHATPRASLKANA
jgi:hypothetical protein